MQHQSRCRRADKSEREKKLFQPFSHPEIEIEVERDSSFDERVKTSRKLKESSNFVDLSVERKLI